MDYIFSFNAFNHWQSIVGDFINHQVYLFFDRFIEFGWDIFHLNCKDRRSDCLLVQNFSYYSDQIRTNWFILVHFDTSSLNIDWDQIGIITKWTPSDLVDSWVLPNSFPTCGFRLELIDVKRHISNFSHCNEICSRLCDRSGRSYLLYPLTPTDLGYLRLIYVDNSEGICVINKCFITWLEDWSG